MQYWRNQQFKKRQTKLNAGIDVYFTYHRSVLQFIHKHDTLYK